MKLQSDFEYIRFSLKNRESLSKLDGCLGKLLRDEQRLITRASLEQQQNQVASIPVAYAAQIEIQISGYV